MKNHGFSSMCGVASGPPLVTLVHIFLSDFSIRLEYFTVSFAGENIEFEEELELEEDGDFEFEENHRKIPIYKT